MTRSNRTLNRALLAVVGLIAIAVAVLVLVPALPDAWIAAVGLDRELLRVAAPTPTVLWVAAAIAALLVVLALAWVLTRGRGRTGTPFLGEGLELDIRVVEQLLRDDLAGAPDLVAVHAAAYRGRRVTTVRVRLDARRGADLPRLLAAADTAVGRLDRTLGVELPMLVHVTTGVRTALSREHRAA